MLKIMLMRAPLLIGALFLSGCAGLLVTHPEKISIANPSTLDTCGKMVWGVSSTAEDNARKTRAKAEVAERAGGMFGDWVERLLLCLSAGDAGPARRSRQFQKGAGFI